MGRYANKITHSFSNDPSRPTFDETIQVARKMILKAYLEKLTDEQQKYVLQELTKDGYIK